MGKNVKIAVIGAGASGMMAAISAAENGAFVTLYEGMDRVGKKILVTGNGKCNFTNSEMSLTNYYTSDYKLLENAFQTFGAKETIAFFEKLGLLVKNKNGYYYPACEQASAVLDLLRLEIHRQDIKLLTEEKIKRIDINGKGKFVLQASDGKAVFDRVILACGGKASPKTGSDGTGYELAKQFGHKIVPVVPGLVQMVCKEPFFKGIAGVRTEGSVAVMRNLNIVCRENGEIQFTEYGISGIPVFQISRCMNQMLRKDKEISVVLDLLPSMSEAELKKNLENRLKRDQTFTVEEFFTGILNKKLMLQFIKNVGLKPTDRVSQIKRESLENVMNMCKKFEVTVTGNKGFENAQVCAGGVSVEEITKSMESIYVPGLFFAGELLDVDGKCGGYNLQWAWTSGFIAGKAAADLENRGE